MRRQRERGLRALAAVALAGAATAHAEPSPRWELGLGIGTFIFNDYRGADTTHAYPIPVPYFIYRGPFLKSDQEGVRGDFVAQPRFAVTLSVNGTTPVRNDSARAGMPDLRSTLEVGASLNVHLWRSDTQRFKLDLRLPVRAAFTIEASPRYVGVFGAPQLNLDVAQPRGARGWKLGVLAGPLFADQRYHEYFYGVDPQYATPQRPAYDAKGGYSGTQVLVSLTRRYPRYWIGAYLRHDFLQGAAFADSPVVRSESYWAGGFGIAWLIGQSATMVEANE